MALGDRVNSWVIDTSRSPLVVTTFGKSMNDDDDVKDMIKAADALFAKKTRFLHLLDLRNIERPANATQRKLMGDWYRTVKATNANACVVATAVLVESTVVRGAMTAVLWLVNPAGERTEAFSKMDDAMRWLDKVAAENGWTIPKGR